MSGPSATEKPMSAKIAVSSSITWLIGWMRPRVSGPSRTGRLTSMRSAARRRSSAASASASLRVAIAAWTLSRSPLMSGPFSLRSSGVMAPSVFRRSETTPFLPSADTRSASSAASSGAPSTCPSRSRSSAARSVIRVWLSRGLFPSRARPSSASARKRMRRRAAGGKASKGWDDGASFAPPAVRLGRRRERRQRALCALDIGGECRRLVDRHLGQHLAIDLDPRPAEAVDKSRIGQAVLAHRRVEALDPERPEGALLVLAVAVGVLHRPVDRGLRGPDRVLAPADEALGGFEGLLVLGVARDAPFHAGHG